MIWQNTILGVIRAICTAAWVTMNTKTEVIYIDGEGNVHTRWV